jgi:hypothetical protein
MQTSSETITKKRLYYLYPEEQRPKKLAALKEQLPEILHRLAKLPIARGEVDQAQDLLTEFNPDWNKFRVEAMRCGAKDWLKHNVYNTPAWKNRDALKQSSTGYRAWKKKYNAERYKSLSEDKLEAKRKADRESKREKRKGDWLDFERVIGLAQRCLKHNPKATVVEYAPVTRLIKKHVPNSIERVKEIVGVALKLLRWNPEAPETDKALKQAMKFAAFKPDVQEFWLEKARELYEARVTPSKLENEVLAQVDSDLDRMLATQEPETPVMVSTAPEPEYDETDDVSLDDDDYRTLGLYDDHEAEAQED